MRRKACMHWRYPMADSQTCAHKVLSLRTRSRIHNNRPQFASIRLSPSLIACKKRLHHNEYVSKRCLIKSKVLPTQISTSSLYIFQIFCITFLSHFTVWNYKTFQVLILSEILLRPTQDTNYMYSQFATKRTQFVRPSYIFSHDEQQNLTELEIRL